MEHIDLKMFLRNFVAFLICAFCLFLILDSFVFNSPVFSVSSNESPAVQWDYLSEREQRNKAKMRASYEDLMVIGNIYVKERNWELAIENYYWAKTLFPERIEPRKNLCYSYFMLCQEDFGFCRKGKRELYYAMKYVDPADENTFRYLRRLVDIVGLEQVVDLEEGEALALLY